MTTQNDGVPRRHPSLFEPATLALIAILCVFGAIIGMQLLVSLGITANTSLIGALAAMALARVPLAIFARYRSIHVQNLAQSAISSAVKSSCTCGIGEPPPARRLARAPDGSGGNSSSGATRPYAARTIGADSSVCCSSTSTGSRS